MNNKNKLYEYIMFLSGGILFFLLGLYVLFFPVIDYYKSTIEKKVYAYKIVEKGKYTNIVDFKYYAGDNEYSCRKKVNANHIKDLENYKIRYYEDSPSNCHIIDNGINYSGIFFTFLGAIHIIFGFYNIKKLNKIKSRK